MAKILRVDHICFAVKDLERTVSFIKKVLGGKHLPIQQSEGETTNAVFDIGGLIFNFVSAPTDGESFFADFLRKNGEGLHHIGLAVDDLDDFNRLCLLME